MLYMYTSQWFKLFNRAKDNTIGCSCLFTKKKKNKFNIGACLNEHVNIIVHGNMTHVNPRLLNTAINFLKILLDF